MIDITMADLALVGFLCFLEGILSIDNALVLAMMVKHLPPKQRQKALTYGLLGAVVFRLICLALATQLMQWRWVKLAGGAYLLFIGIKHFFKNEKEEGKDLARKAGFWKTVVLVELMDIAFAVDSILAAVAVTRKFWIVFAGGMAGVVLIRFAAGIFIKLLERFPNFENAAFAMIVTIGIKVFVEGLHLEGLDFHDSSKWPFWVFWGTMAAALGSGFFGARDKK